jgi:hypothetical protein
MEIGISMPTAYSTIPSNFRLFWVQAMILAPQLASSLSTSLSGNMCPLPRVVGAQTITLVKKGLRTTGAMLDHR